VSPIKNSMLNQTFYSRVQMCECKRWTLMCRKYLHYFKSRASVL